MINNEFVLHAKDSTGKVDLCADFKIPLTWILSRIFFSYLSTVEVDTSFVTSSSKCRRMKEDRNLYGGVRKYNQLCKFRKKQKSILMFEVASFCASYMQGWCVCFECLALYTLLIAICLLSKYWLKGLW
jgi:hypothetical protein